VLETFSNTTFTADGMVSKSWPFGEGRELFNNDVFVQAHSEAHGD